MADKRDRKTWVILELTRQGEQKVTDGNFERVLRKALKLDPDHGIFIPAATYKKAGRTVTLHLMEGYAFVESGLLETVYFKLEGHQDIKRIMSSASPSGMRIPHTLSDLELQKMRDKLRTMVMGDVTPGSMVNISDGTYKGMDGEVLDIEEDYAILKIEMRSLAIVTKIPQVFLEVMD